MSLPHIIVPLIYVSELTRRLGFHGRRFLQRIQFRQHFGAMATWIDARVRLRNLPGGINEEGISRRELHHSKVGQRSVGSRHFVVRIGQQLETESFLCAELLVRVHAVKAHSHDDCVALGVLGLVHLELVGFARSTRSLIFRIEIEDNPLSPVVLQPDGTAVLRRQGEIWSYASLRRFRRTRQQPWNQKRGSNYDQHQHDNPEHRSLPRGTITDSKPVPRHRSKRINQEGHGSYTKEVASLGFP